MRRTDCTICAVLEFDAASAESNLQCIHCRQFFCPLHMVAHCCNRDLFDWMRGFVASFERGDMRMPHDPGPGALRAPMKLRLIQRKQSKQR